MPIARFVFPLKFEMDNEQDRRALSVIFDHLGISQSDRYKHISDALKLENRCSRELFEKERDA